MEVDEQKTVETPSMVGTVEKPSIDETAKTPSIHENVKTLSMEVDQQKTVKIPCIREIVKTQSIDEIAMTPPPIGETVKTPFIDETVKTLSMEIDEQKTVKTSSMEIDEQKTVETPSNDGTVKTLSMEVDEQKTVETSSDDDTVETSSDDETDETSSSDESTETSSDDESVKTPPIEVDEQKTLKTPSNDDTVEIPSKNETVKTASNDKTVEIPSRNEAVKTPSNDETVEISSKNETVKTPSNDETIETPFKNETVKTPSNDETVKIPSNDETVEAPSKNETVKAPSENETVKAPSKNETVERLSKNETDEKPSYNKTVKTPSNDENVKSPSNDENVKTLANEETVVTPCNAETVETPSNDEIVETPSNDETVETQSNDETVETPSNDETVGTPSIDDVNLDDKSAPESNSMDTDTIDSDDVEMIEPDESENLAPSEDAADDLRHFDVLDDLDRHSNQEGSDSEVCSNDTLDSDIPDDEIEAMLEEGLPDEFKGKRSGRRCDVLYDQKEKVVLNEMGHNHFDVLPEGWVQVTHNSGMPLYLHKPTRVCTLSKPYFLGPGSVRKHNVPISAIPCLQYRKALKEEEEGKQKETEKLQAAQTGTMPNAKIETIQENRAAQSLDGESLRNYCKALFQFKSIKVMRFKSWSQRRKFTKIKKQRKQLERPTLPDGTKLITFPVVASNNATGSNFLQEEELPKRPPKHWIMNPSGKSYVCILHEYVQHALKKQPTYKFKELENAATPYSAVVCINNMEYGSGYGSSKKQAKANAARKTLEILIPQMRDKISCDPTADSNSPNSNLANKASKINSDADLSFFDEITITDPRVAEFCAKTTEPLPHAILITCLQRNFGLGDMHINYSVNTLKHQRNEFTMRVGKHEATVICRNKKDGKQRAAQAILQLLHPHIQSWGSLLRLYGSRSVKSFKEKKQLEQEITLLQGKAAVNQPNHAILEKLRQEMRKLSEQREAVKPIGKFVPPDLPTGSSSNLDNVDL